MVSATVLALITMFTILVFLPVAIGCGLASLLLVLLALPDLVASDEQYEPQAQRAA